MRSISLSIIAACFMLAIASCSDIKSEKSQTATTLDTSAIYNSDEVLQFVKANPLITKESVTNFSKGVDEYRNNKNLDKAYGLFLSSVISHPSARAYFELANVCTEKKDYDNALAAFHIAEQLGYEPVSKVYYNIACVYSLQEKENESATYLEYAIEAGYSNLDQIKADSDLAYLRKSYIFEATYQEALSGSSDPEVTLWQSFKREFKTLMLPVVLTLETQIAEAKNINFEFEKYVSEMRTEKFSREVGKEFYYYGIVEDNANYTAMIYAIKNTIMSEDAPSRYVLVSFDSRGTLIDKKPVGGQLSLSDPYLVCAIQPNLRFEIKQYKNTYEKDPMENGFKDNPLKKSELLATEYYMINETGKFVQLTEKLTML